MHIKLANKVIIGIILTAVLQASIMLWPVSTPSDWQGGWIMYHVPLAMASAYAWLYVGAAVLFLMGIGVYKAKLRHAYTIIVLGIFMNAVGAMQIPIIGWLNLSQSWWVQSGIYSLPFVSGSILIYLGVRNFALVVNVKTVFARFTFVLPVIASICALVALLPHAAFPTPEIAYDIANMAATLSAFMFLAAGLTIVPIRQLTGSHYVNALNWLAAGSVAGFFVAFTILLDSLIQNSAPSILTIGINFITLAQSLMLLLAGYLFYETREY